MPVNASPARPATMAAVTHLEFRARAAASAGPRSRAARAHGLPSDVEANFLIELGRRLREARLLLAMSRRELARRSGISERYIAEIEAGRGNVSIVLLLRIIRAVREVP
jgi:XRE family aerobic/anaerobic benzoate catabolism transcriptional regulator